MNPYRTPGVMFYIPRSKAEKIQLILSQGWKGTKTALRDMNHKQLKAIIIDYRRRFELEMMRKPVEPLKIAKISNNTNTEPRGET